MKALGGLGSGFRIIRWLLWPPFCIDVSMSTPWNLGLVAKVVCLPKPKALSALLGYTGKILPAEFVGLQRTLDVSARVFERDRVPGYESFEIAAQDLKKTMDGRVSSKRQAREIEKSVLIPLAFHLRNIAEDSYFEGMEKVVNGNRLLIEPRGDNRELFLMHMLQYPFGFTWMTHIPFYDAWYRLAGEPDDQARLWGMWGDWLSIGGRSAMAMNAYLREGDHWLRATIAYSKDETLFERFPLLGRGRDPSVVEGASLLFGLAKKGFERGGNLEKARIVNGFLEDLAGEEGFDDQLHLLTALIEDAEALI